ncbi:hypothetical protein [Pseudomonas sp. AB12(2023)]|uniref:hypothetical protein n=1 Tax=Pseudomonas sp. AB12(2023) TaxID=3048597 RepID=UPI002B23B5A1|nr:hypothetical protein [Pseudomonas sp. AB12(2023)]MEB0221344.1 hypothetical protein [Pseudomonas sp. AB12(2023)]
MDSDVKKSLEAEWTARQNAVLAERIVIEEAVKSDLVNALQERLKELKQTARSERAEKPLGERIREASGLSSPRNYYDQKSAKLAIKELTKTNISANQEIGGTERHHRSYSDQLRFEREFAANEIKVGKGYREQRDTWVAAQAELRLSPTDLKPPTEVSNPVSEGVLEEVNRKRSERLKEYVEQITNSQGTYHQYGLAGNYADLEARKRPNEEWIEGLRVSGRGADAAQHQQTQDAEPAVALKVAEPQPSFRAVAAIEARAEIYQESVSEIGLEATTASLEISDVQAWVSADERDINHIDNSQDASDAIVAVAETSQTLVAYRELVAQMQANLIQHEAELTRKEKIQSQIISLPKGEHANPVFINDTKFPINISPEGAAKEIRKAADMAKLTDADLAETVLTVQRAELIADPELAAGIANEAGRNGHKIPEVIDNRVDLIEVYKEGLIDRETDFAIAEKYEDEIISSQQHNDLKSLLSVADQKISALNSPQATRLDAALVNDDIKLQDKKPDTEISTNKLNAMWLVEKSAAIDAAHLSRQNSRENDKQTFLNNLKKFGTELKRLIENRPLIERFRDAIGLPDNNSVSAKAIAATVREIDVAQRAHTTFRDFDDTYISLNNAVRDGQFAQALRDTTERDAWVIARRSNPDHTPEPVTAILKGSMPAFAAATKDLVKQMQGSPASTPVKQVSLPEWSAVLDQVANKERRGLSGGEFKSVVASIENASRGYELDKALVQEVASKLAKVHGPSSERLFKDPVLRSAYKSGNAPAPVNRREEATTVDPLGEQNSKAKHSGLRMK